MLPWVTYKSNKGEIKTKLIKKCSCTVDVWVWCTYGIDNAVTFKMIMHMWREIFFSHFKSNFPQGFFFQCYFSITIPTHYFVKNHFMTDICNRLYTAFHVVWHVTIFSPQITAIMNWFTLKNNLCVDLHIMLNSKQTTHIVA